MRGFARKGPVIRVRLDEYEITILESLLEQLRGLLEADGEVPPGEDSFARWQAEFSEPEVLDRSDPVIRRLFPSAYPDDEAASDEFRRFTQARQRSQRIGQAEVVIAALREAGGGVRPVQVRVAEIDQWLKALGAVRLSLAVRLGIEQSEDADQVAALPEDDPRSFAYRVYEWLGYFTERLLGLL